MINQRKLIRVTEVSLILFIWLVLLITPVLFKEDNNKPILESVLNQFKTLIPLSMLLIFNRLYLVPRLLFKGRTVTFLATVTCLIVLLTFVVYLADQGKVVAKPPVEQPSGKPVPPPFNSTKPEPPPREDEQGKKRPPGQRKSEPVPAFANFFILAVLIIGYDTGLRSTLKWLKAEQEKAILEKENVANQLLLLRNQVSPHFFMNTLNNIHTLIDINAEEAKLALIRLSKMMRYLLPESDTKESTLAAEVEFIGSYVRLMKIRLSERVKITVDLPEIIPEKSIQPFLFIPIVENAFKYGISYKDESYINITMAIGDNRLLFIVKNSKATGYMPDGYSGTTIDIIRKRLSLLYGNDYSLDIIENAQNCTVNLSIPI